jgi:hypothetical protein
MGEGEKGRKGELKIENINLKNEKKALDFDNSDDTCCRFFTKNTDP